MKIEQAAMLLELAKNVMLDIDGVISIRTPIISECEFEVHLTKGIFDTLHGTVVIEYEPKDDDSYGRLNKKVNGTTFFTLVTVKEFAELYPQIEERGNCDGSK